jgi:DNA-binding LacI/PurR family transcriptional regulator
MPTFKQLCDELNVSKTTLDTALAELEKEHFIYRKHGIGIFASPTLRHSIALVCAPGFFASPQVRDFWELLMREAQLRVAETHYDLAFHFSTIGPNSLTSGLPLHPGLMDDICAGRVQGVLTIGLPTETVDWMSQQGVAVVAFAGEGPVSVNVGPEQVMEVGVAALVGRGCRRLTVWTDLESQPRKAECSEEQAFLRVLALHDLKFHDNYLKPQGSEATEYSNYELACHWASQVFKGPRDSWPDGLLVSKDIVAQDVIPALLESGIVPNRDLIIASHANAGSPVLRAYEDDLMLIEYNSAEIVQIMFDQLEALLRGEAPVKKMTMVRPGLKIGRLVPPASSDLF